MAGIKDLCMTAVLHSYSIQHNGMNQNQKSIIIVSSSVCEVTFVTKDRVYLKLVVSPSYLK